jgi:hypothetical protein
MTSSIQQTMKRKKKPNDIIFNEIRGNIFENYKLIIILFVNNTKTYKRNSEPSMINTTRRII